MGKEMAGRASLKGCFMRGPLVPLWSWVSWPYAMLGRALGEILGPFQVSRAATAGVTALRYRKDPVR